MRLHWDSYAIAAAFLAGGFVLLLVALFATLVEDWLDHRLDAPSRVEREKRRGVAPRHRAADSPRSAP